MFMPSALQFETAAPAMPPAGPGLVASALIETATGWRPAGMLRPGATVQTWDGGLCALAGLDRRWLWPGQGQALVHVPGGAFGACADLWLSPDTELYLACPAAEEILEAPGALVPAAALVGHAGCRLAPVERPVQLVLPKLDSDELVWVQSGVLIRAAADRPGIDGFLPRLGGKRASALAGLVACGARTTADLPRRAA